MPSTSRILLRSGGRALPAVLLLLLPSGASAASGPELRSLADVKALPGTLVAQARTAAPETALRIQGYRIDHVALPRPQVVSLAGEKTEVREAWRITVQFQRPLTVRAQAFSLVLDGRWCGFLAEAPDLRSADTVCFDRDLIRDGAVLGVTYRGIQIAAGPEAEMLLGPDAELEAGDEPIHYTSRRLQLQGAR